MKYRSAKRVQYGLFSWTPKGFKHCLSPYFIGFVGGGVNQSNEERTVFMYIQQILCLRNIDFWAFFITNRNPLMKEK